MEGSIVHLTELRRKRNSISSGCFRNVVCVIILYELSKSQKLSKSDYSFQNSWFFAIILSFLQCRCVVEERNMHWYQVKMHFQKCAFSMNESLLAEQKLCAKLRPIIKFKSRFFLQCFKFIATFVHERFGSVNYTLLF